MSKIDQFREGLKQLKPLVSGNSILSKALTDLIAKTQDFAGPEHGKRRGRPKLSGFKAAEYEEKLNEQIDLSIQEDDSPEQRQFKLLLKAIIDYAKMLESALAET